MSCIYESYDGLRIARALVRTANRVTQAGFRKQNNPPLVASASRLLR